MACRWPPSCCVLTRIQTPSYKGISHFGLGPTLTFDSLLLTWSFLWKSYLQKTVTFWGTGVKVSTNIYPGAELLGHTVSVYPFKKLASAILHSHQQCKNTTSSSSTLGIVGLVILLDVYSYLIVVLIHTLLLRICSCICWSFMFSLAKCLLQSLAHLKIHLSFYYRAHYIVQIWITVFSPSLWLAFLFSKWYIPKTEAFDCDKVHVSISFLHHFCFFCPKKNLLRNLCLFQNCKEFFLYFL